MEIAFRTLLHRIPTLRLAVPPDRVPTQPGLLARVTELPVTWHRGGRARNAELVSPLHLGRAV
jgi:hypothetical protein